MLVTKVRFLSPGQFNWDRIFSVKSPSNFLAAHLLKKSILLVVLWLYIGLIYYDFSASFLGLNITSDST